MAAGAQVQPVSGTIAAKGEGGLPGASVQIFSLPDSSVYAGRTTDANGNYSFENVVAGNYFLRVSFVGFAAQDKDFKVASTSVRGLNVELAPDVTLINTAVVQELQDRAEQKGDTTVYNAAAFKTNPDATVEDLIKKMPGIADEQGTLKAQGEQVTKVLVDGKEFFGTDTKAAIKNLPAEMVKSIEVFDQQSDQSRFTGFNDGNTSKTINIVTKGGLEKGQFGKLYAGYGTDDRYTAGGNLNYFKGNRRLSVIGMTNNINQQNFASEDITSMSGVQMGPMGGRGGGGGFRGMGDVPFMTSSSGGINTTQSIGLNYNNEWKKKVKLSSSYFFNQRGTENISDMTRNFFSGQSGSQVYNEEKDSQTTNGNHRYNGRLEWNVDSLNSIILTPSVSYTGILDKTLTEGRTTVPGDTLINQSVANRRNQTERLNLSTGLLLQHKFMKPRRTISADFNVSSTFLSGENRLQSQNDFFNENDTSFTVFDQLTEPASKQLSGRVELSYTEPLTEKTVFQVSYKPTYTLDDSDNLTYNLNGGQSTFDTLFSNQFTNVTQTQEAILRWRYNDDKWNLTMGSSLVWSWLDGEQEFPAPGVVNRSFFNLVPEIRGRYSISKSKSWGFNYRAGNTLPNISQLQNLLNNSNPLQLSTGNPDLVQSYNHRLFTRYSGTSDDKTKTFFHMISLGYTRNYVGTSLFIAPKDSVVDNITLSRGAQLSRPVNLNDNLNGRVYSSYGFPLLKLKSNLNINGSINYNQIPGLINDALNMSKTWSTSAGVSITSNISEKIDFTLSSNFSASQVRNTIQPTGDFSFLQYDASARAVWMVTKHWLLSSDVTNYTYDGLEGGFNQTFLLWNAGLGYRIAKKNTGELKLSVFDILGENTSINRQVTDTFIEDSRTQVLTRFFMLSFTYNLRKLSSAEAAPPVWKGTGDGMRPH